MPSVGDVAPKWLEALVDGKFLKAGPNGTVIMGDAVVGTDTAAEIMTKLQTVDGSGSGLDADLLDGQHGAYYLPAATYTAADALAKIKTVDGAGSGLDAELLAGASLDTSTTLASNSDARVPTQKAVKAYCDALIGANDAMVFKGVLDCSANPNYPAADRGWTYRVSVAGKIGGASGVNVENGDMVMCMTDGTAAGNQATVGAQWAIIQLNLDGALTTANLGVTVQGYDAGLAAFAVFNTNGLFVQTANNTYVARSIAGTASQIAVTNADGVAGDPTLSLTGAIATIAAAGIGAFSNYLAGLTLSNNVADATNDIDVAAGIAANSTNADLMVLVGALTKRLDAAWAVGTNQGGRDTGAIADGTWHMYLIKRPDTGVVDVIFSASASAPTLPTNYTLYRRIGSIIRAGGGLVAFTQDGDVFTLVNFSNEISSTNPGTSAVTAAIGVPTGLRLRARIMQTLIETVGNTTSYYLLVSDLANADAVPSVSIFTALLQNDAALASARATGWYEVFTNTSAQIRYRLSASDATLTTRISARGWVDTRGR